MTRTIPRRPVPPTPTGAAGLASDHHTRRARPLVGARRHLHHARRDLLLEMPGWGNIACTVLDVEPPERLVYTFGDWTLTWRLRPEGHGTRLFLEHSGFGPPSVPTTSSPSTTWAPLARRDPPASEPCSTRPAAAATPPPGPQPHRDPEGGARSARCGDLGALDPCRVAAACRCARHDHRRCRSSRRPSRSRRRSTRGRHGHRPPRRLRRAPDRRTWPRHRRRRG